MKHIIYISVCLFLMLMSCDEKELLPISGSLGKPGVATILEQEPIPGGVILTYQIPKTEDILSVKAVYTLSNGRVYEAVSSFYENTLVIKGYNDEKEHTAEVYVLNRAQELSDPVVVKFVPLESPLNKIIKSVQIIPDFGGANFSWINEHRDPVTFEFIAQDSIGQMLVQTVYTSELDTANRSLRGFDAVPWRFATIAMDNYGNRSDSLFPPSIITPLYEERLDKTKQTVMRLGNDASYTNWEGQDYFLIDDNKETFGHSPSASLPAPFTIDLGQVAKLSRVVFFNRFYGESWYSHGNPKKMTVYVCFGTPSSTGDWNDWTKIMDIEQIKPSGTSGTTMTDDDAAYGDAGFEFLFPIDMEPVRYVRITVVDTWTGATFTHPAEVDIFGEPVSN